MDLGTFQQQYATIRALIDNGGYAEGAKRLSALLFDAPVSVKQDPRYWRELDQARFDAALLAKEYLDRVRGTHARRGLITVMRENLEPFGWDRKIPPDPMLRQSALALLARLPELTPDPNENPNRTRLSFPA